jgi:hypothetical protein
MPIKIIAQRDYLLTEVSIEASSCELNDLDELMKASHGTGKIVSVYTQGSNSGINVEQKTKIRDGVVDRVRALVGVESKELNGHDK